MPKIIIFLFICLLCCRCSNKKEAINFITLRETEFNAKSFGLPDSRIIDSIKHTHDSCMGFSFDANAMLLSTKDTLFIGSIVNKQTGKVVNTVQDLGITGDKISSMFTILSSPCYEKHVLNFPLRLLLGDHFIIQLPGNNETLNKEMNADLLASEGAELQTGSWFYLDMKDALKNILDSAKSSAGLRYRSHLLDTANMVLTAVESITDVSFIINTGKNISDSLQALLKTKPVVSQPASKVSVRLAYIDDDKFEMAFSGIFPMAGQFMKAELK